jgi:deoxyribodipyrimidine photolyase
LALLASFLDKRVAFYPRGQASPLTASDACSRLSPHLAWGTLSLREVEHARRQRLAQLDPLDRHSQRLRAGLDAFAQRLRWHGQARQTISTLPGGDTAPTRRSLPTCCAPGATAKPAIRWWTPAWPCCTPPAGSITACARC